VKTQKTIAVIMIVTSSILTALVTGNIAYPTILCMLGLLGLQRRFTWQIKPERRIIKSLLMLLLAVMFAVHYSYIGFSHQAMFAPAGAAAWQTIACYFMASMILILFLGAPDRLPPSMGFFHLAVAISAGQVLLLDDRYIAFRLVELGSAILAILYTTSADNFSSKLVTERIVKSSRWLSVGLILAVVANIGWIGGSILYRHAEILNYLPVWFWRVDAAGGNNSGGASHIGFSKSGMLSSILQIQGDQDPTPVLTITADRNPGYLRAMSFEMYRQSQWLDLSNREALFPEERPFGAYFGGRTNTFRLRSREAPRTEYMTIRHELRFRETMFTPLGTSSIEAPVSLMLRDDDDIIYSRNLPSGLNYRVAYSATPYQRPPTGMQVRRMLNVPARLDRRIYQLADGIFSRCVTANEKMEAVVDYFRTNYTYSLSMNIPPGVDNLTYFLLEGTSGYCEYFASGSAILLRLAGVPTRYVTGFLVTERDPASGSWVARNMNAHAWVEAWDQELGKWTIVEATVQDNLASTETERDLSTTGGGGGIDFRRLLQDIYQYGIVGIFGWFFKSYGLVAGLLISSFFAGSAVFLAVWQRLKEGKTKTFLRSRKGEDAIVASMHKMLNRMDRKVKAAGQQRNNTETLHTFSNRLRAQDAGDGIWARISDWYLEYADLRYNKPSGWRRLRKVQEMADSLRNIR